MAAFSYQDLPFLVDCVLTPDMLMKLSSSSPSSTITSPLLSPSCCFSEDQPPHHHLLTSNSSYPEPIFHGEQLQLQYPYGSFPQEEFKPIDFSLHESSCVEQGTPLAIAQSTPASSDNGVGGGTQICTPVKNKRKPKGDGSSPNPSKGLRGGRSKKQKNNNNGGVKKEKEEEEEEEDQKKTQSQSPSPSPTAAEEAPKGYIHVRARRGQATDSHSLAERARREKISERMNLLQALVPGCDKVTGKATMLDEIINYVRSLQTQVEFLSMKLTSLNPMVYNFGLDLDALLLGQQVMNNTAPPVGLLQQCSQSITNPITETPATAVATTGMPTLVQQQGQRGAIPPCLEEDVIGSLYWGLGGQGGPDPVNQTGCIN